MSAPELEAGFARRVSRLETVRTQGARAFASNALRQTDLDHLFESTFLSAVTEFEAFLETLFYDCVLDTSAIQDVHPRATFESRTHAEATVTRLARQPFVSWNRYDEVQDRAELLLLGARPFSRLDHRPVELTLLREARLIRNAIAHRSGEARDAFLTKVSLPPLPPTRRHPAGFLQALNGAVSTHARFCAGLRSIAKALSAATASAARTFLQSEAEHAAGSKPGLGSYRCVQCGLRLRLYSPSRPLPLCTCTPKCATCSKPTTSNRYQRA